MAVLIGIRMTDIREVARMASFLRERSIPAFEDEAMRCRKRAVPSMY